MRPMDRSRRPLGLTLGVLLATQIAACSSTPPSESGAPAESQIASTACDAARLDLRSPTGRPVNLTGAWRANDGGIYHLQQEGGCIYWLGQSDAPGSELGVEWTNVFVGSVHDDFTITGSWGDVPTRVTRHAMVGPPVPVSNTDLGDGELAIRIEFDESGASEEPFLVAQSATGSDLGGSRWVLESSMPAPSETVGTFNGKENNCFWVEANGTRYEFDLPSITMVYEANPPSIRNPLGDTLFTQGDPIRVLGRVKSLLASGCQPNYILTTEISPAS
jgi:hypothetical protein